MNLLSRRSVLAIAAVVDVALHSRSGPVAAKALAARHKLPPRHLETLLQGLVHAEILKGVRGPRGGNELARERRRITVGEIVAPRCREALIRKISAQTRCCSTGNRSAERRSARPSSLISMRSQSSRCATRAENPRARRREGQRAIRHLACRLRRCIALCRIKCYCRAALDGAVRRAPGWRPLTDAGAARRTPGRGKVYASITDTIGDTPARQHRPDRQGKGLVARLLAKLEFFNRSPASRTASAFR